VESRFFAISDAITLLPSIASMMMFFSFFTAHYEEEDILMDLPRKLAIGRTIFFFSTISMIVTFGSVFFIVLDGYNKPCVIGLVILVKREGMDKTSFLTIRHSYIFLIYKTTKYNSLYSLNI
jgi:hypothetical protein